MIYDQQYLYDKYNATSTDDGKGDIETYENWLERQLISRLERIDALEAKSKIIEKANGQEWKFDHTRQFKVMR